MTRSGLRPRPTLWNCGTYFDMQIWARDTNSTHRLRQFLKAACLLGLTGNRMPDDDLIMVANELVINAITASECLPRHQARVKFRVYRSEDLELVIEVTDYAPGLPVWRNPEPDDLGGRGLQICDHYCDSVTWRDREIGGKTVTAILKPVAVRAREAREAV